MIRKQVYLLPEQDRLLKDLARQLHVTEAQVIRRAIETQVPVLRPAGPDITAWRAELEFIKERSRQLGRGRKKERRWKREDLYEERLGRYARTRNR